MKVRSTLFLLSPLLLIAGAQAMAAAPLAGKWRVGDGMRIVRQVPNNALSFKVTNAGPSKSSTVEIQSPSGDVLATVPAGGFVTLPVDLTNTKNIVIKDTGGGTPAQGILYWL